MARCTRLLLRAMPLFPLAWAALGAFTSFGVVPEPVQETTPLRGVAVVFDGPRWMQVDPVHETLLVLDDGCSASRPMPRLLVLDPAGAVLDDRSVPALAQFLCGSGQGFPIEAVFLPRLHKLAVRDAGYGSEPESVYLVDTHSGDVLDLGADVTALAGDPERGVLFLGRGKSFHVVEAAAGRSVQAVDSPSTVDRIFASPDGSVRFLMQGLARGGGPVDRLVTLTPSYSIDPARTTDVPPQDGADRTLVGVDVERGRLFISDSWPDPPCDGPSTLTIVEQKTQCARVFPFTVSEQIYGLDYFGERDCTRSLPLTDSEPNGLELFGPVDGGPYLVLHGQDGALYVHDAATLRQITTLKDFSGELIGRDAQGGLLISRDSTVERLDQRSLAVTQSLRLAGEVQLSALDRDKRAAYLMVESGDAANRSERLVCIDLDSFRLRPMHRQASR
jgi:hypothetical protein